MTETRRRRVPAMAPEDRRAALIEATIPLLHEHGLEVSTKQIAQAAGVAEGTIFGVFKDKNSLVVAALMRALDPRPTIDALEAIGTEGDLRERLTVAANLINERFTTSAPLLGAARHLMHQHAQDPEAMKNMAETRTRLLEALTTVIKPDEDLLRSPAATTAQLLLLFCGANTYGPFGDPKRFTGSEMVSLLLDGLLVPDPTKHQTGVRKHTC